jgi:hypothetical protein
MFIIAKLNLMLEVIKNELKTDRKKDEVDNHNK